MLNATQPTQCLEGQAHYWIVQTAHGPKSPSICKRCKTEREFINSFDKLSWAETRNAMPPDIVENTLFPRAREWSERETE